MKMMKAAFVAGGTTIDSVTIREVPVPTAGPGEALVRLKAATLNFRDLLYIGGKVPGAKTPEYIPLSCAAGEVVAVADGVTRVKPGDRVSPLFALGWFDGPRPTTQMLGGPIDGVARNYGAFDAESLCLLPDEISDLEAATLPCAGLTAWTALFGPRPLAAGEWVLVQGTGGVSIAALQWAKASGANVIATSSSDAKLRRAQALGADITINYRTTPDWPAAARQALGGRGVDIVVDVVGMAGLEACARVVGDGGIISEVGRLTGEASWGRDIGKPAATIVVGNRGQHEAMLAFTAKQRIRPVIDTVYDLTRLSAALHHQASGQFFGKIGINLL
jgi:NADPH:quinone reductase-like Zn-dependent oxidoreductase